MSSPLRIPSALLTLVPLVLTVACGSGVPPAPVGQIDLASYQLVDLTHPFDQRTLYWPTSPSRFSQDTLSYGPSEGGYFYSSFTLSTPEHGGTHLDAPLHFAAGAEAVDAVPLSRLVAPAVVIDVQGRAEANRDYLLSRGDVLEWEAEHGAVPRGAIVLLRTGWSRYWPDPLTYLGDDTAGDASALSFPSFGEDAARLLVEERGVSALGADVASIDFGRSTDFLVHRLAGAANIPGFENLTNLGLLPPTGALVIALPMKIGGGTGAPLRAIALVPR